MENQQIATGLQEVRRSSAIGNGHNNIRASIRSNVSESQNATSPTINGITSSNSHNENVEYTKIFPKTLMISLSILQVVLATLCFVAEVIAIYVVQYHYWAGVWCGIFFVWSALFGIIASFKPRFLTFLLMLIFNVLSSIFSLLLLILVSIELDDNYENDTLRAMLGLQLILCLVQATAVIASAALICNAICWCCCNPQNWFEDHSSQIYYISNNNCPEAGNMVKISSTKRLPSPPSQLHSKSVFVPIGPRSTDASSDTSSASNSAQTNSQVTINGIQNTDSSFRRQIPNPPIYEQL